MIRNSKHSLKKFVYRTLIIRLAAAGLIISIILGLTVFLFERNRIREQVIDHALRAVRLFNAQNYQLFDAPGLPHHDKIQKELLAFSADYKKLKTGRFVFVRMYDLELTKIAELIDKEYESIGAIESLMDSAEFKGLKGREASDEIVRTAGRPYLKVTVPIINSKDEIVGSVLGFFAPSAKTIAYVRKRAVRTMYVTSGVVLVTTVLLYPVIITLTRRLSAMSVNLLDSQLETLKVLGSAIAIRDSDTDAHNYRVTIFSVRLAEAIGLSTQTIQKLIKGAFLHDVGKIGIRDEVLLKPGRLSDKEFSIMKKHVQYGEDIVQSSAWLRDALEVVGYHHEKLNGEGYLKRFHGEEIPVTARIFAIADVFDALTSRRPYKEPFPFDQAMSILEEGRGSHFDPVLLDAFERIARSLYEDISGRDSEARKELDKIIQKYFAEGIESLDY